MSHTIQWTTTDAPFVPQVPSLVSFEPNPDAEGYVDWFELLPTTHPTNKRWRREVGTYIARKVMGRNTGKFYCMFIAHIG
jgi:hypothetical protein